MYLQQFKIIKGKDDAWKNPQSAEKIHKVQRQKKIASRSFFLKIYTDTYFWENNKLSTVFLGAPK